jgi:hypothetical protein
MSNIEETQAGPYNAPGGSGSTTEGHPIDRQLALMLKGEFVEARKISDELEALGPSGIPGPDGKLNNPEMWVRHSFNRGWFLLNEGKYKEGCERLEFGRHINVYGSPPLRTNAPIFNPSEHSMEGKSVILSLEGGYGDEIIHARFATSLKKKLKAAKVYLAADPILHSILSRIEGVDACITRAETNKVVHDYWMPGFSAGWLCGHTFEDFPGKPYLSPKKDTTDLWKEFMDSTDKKKVKVGIRWAGNPKFEHQQFRKFPPEFMLNLASYEGVQLYSLQRDDNIIKLPKEVIDLQDLLITWEDTLAVIENLDIVITSCTSIAHVAAGMGKETWVMVPILPYHTWTLNAPQSVTSPYYDAARLYRQTAKGKWNDTFQRMYADFEKKFKLKSVEHPDHDREAKRLNLGCGFKKFEGFHNVDYSDICSPDEIVELNSKSWPWPDNEYTHIVAKDILEHLGHDGVSFTDIIKEMYRVSDNAAIWEVQVPHHRCDIAWDDPSHVRVITPTTFRLFDKKRAYEKIVAGETDSYLSFLHDVDIEVIDTAYEFTDVARMAIDKGFLKEEQMELAMNAWSNIILSTKILIQVHKPGRYNAKEAKAAAQAHSKLPMSATPSLVK